MQTSDAEARAIRQWMEERGATFLTGPKHEEHLTDDQILLQCKMYIAALRIADDFGCNLIGIQYQQGLKDLLPASDLVEGSLNNTERPPARSRDGKRVLYDGLPLTHFNEVDECAGLDGWITNRVQTALGQPIENTLHDVRWADADASGTTQDYVWVFEISGSAPPAHFDGGWAGAEGFRQPAMYFPNGGSTLRGISKPGEIVWSRIYVEEGKLCLDVGRGAAISLPREETERRWNSTTPEWPIMHAVLYGVSRDQMMAQHKSNHVQVVYSTDAAAADRTLEVKAAMAHSIGLRVNRCGASSR
jgi:L-fucose isomerase-like protein